jgi:hypothetical protein
MERLGSLQTIGVGHPVTAPSVNPGEAAGNLIEAVIERGAGPGGETVPGGAKGRNHLIDPGPRHPPPDQLVSFEQVSSQNVEGTRLEQVSLQE